MRICFVSYELHPLTQGGCGTFVAEAAREALAGGAHVTLLLHVSDEVIAAAKSWAATTLPNAANLRIERVVETNDELPADANIFERRSWEVAKALVKLLRSEPFDYVELFEYCGIAYYALLAKLRGDIPDETTMAVRAHGAMEHIDAQDPWKPFTREAYRQYALERAALRLAESVVVPSAAYGDAYLAPDGLDTGARVVASPHADPLLRLPKDIAAGASDVLFFGRLLPVKGADTFVQGASQYLRDSGDTSTRFLLAGPDNYLVEGETYGTRLRKLIPSDLVSRFVFLGGVDHATLGRLLERTRCAVFPNRFETFCYAAHEVFGSGCRIIARAIPAFVGAFGDKAGARFFDGTASSLAQALAAELAQPAMRHDDVALPPVMTALTTAPKRPLNRQRAQLRATILLLAQATGDEVVGRALAARLARATTSVPPAIYLARPPRSSDESVCELLGELRMLEPVSSSAPAIARSGDLLWVLDARDDVDCRFFESAVVVLERNSHVGYVAPFLVGEGFTAMPVADVAPELLPLATPGCPTRVVLRTQVGVELPNLFDRDLHALGEVALAWKSCAGGAQGIAWPLDTMRVTPSANRRPAPAHVRVLLERYGNPRFDHALARWHAALLDGGSVAAAPDAERKILRPGLRALGREVVSALRAGIRSTMAPGHSP